MYEVHPTGEEQSAAQRAAGEFAAYVQALAAPRAARPGLDLVSDLAAALLGAANRDPAVFDEPDRFRPERDPNPHVAFGAGTHFCLGAPLVRLQLETSVGALLRRFPRLEVVEAVRRPTFVLRGYERLPARPG